MQDINDHDDHQDPKPKLWRWADPSRYPIPEPEGDPWDTLLQTLLKKDRVRCEAWKDEVQNLLIFAGLFSAVITGFVVDSYKNLQPDLNTTAILLLARIADRLDQVTNTSQVVQPSNPPSFMPTLTSPTSFDLRINTFWFLSLILSLTTVVIGIVCLQWLREHQRYTEPLTPKQALAVFHMRAKGLETWYIPQIFTGLPLLLQAAVILFFGGLVDFLVSLNLTLAIPAIILVVITLLFLIVTTILPVLQCFTVSVSWPSRKAFNITQCPYKSPQAWAFRNLIILGMQMLAATNRLLQNIGGHVPFAAISQIFHRFSNNAFIRNISNLATKIFRHSSPSFPSDNHHISTPRSMQIIPLCMCLDTSQSSWIDFDAFWLTIRDTHFQFSLGQIKPEDEQFDQVTPPYDLVQALVDSVLEKSVKETVIFAAYHCFRAMCLEIIDNQTVVLGERAHIDIIARTRFRYLQSCFFPTPDFQSLSSSFDKPNLKMMHDETMLLFLDLPGISQYAHNPRHPLGMLLLKRHTRIWLYIFHRWPRSSGEDIKIDPMHPFLAHRNFAERHSEIPEDVLTPMVEQLYLILDRIFEQAESLGSEDPLASIPGYPMLNEFIDYVTCFRPPKKLEPLFLSVLASISKGLDFVFRSQGYDTSDFLFFCARLYLEKLANHPWFAELMKFGPYNLTTPLTTLLKDMLRYEYQLNQGRYADLHNLWTSDLRSRLFSGVRVQTVGSSYVPIPENLLRFLPYESRPENTADAAGKNAGYNPEVHMEFRIRDVVGPTIEV